MAHINGRGVLMALRLTSGGGNSGGNTEGGGGNVQEIFTASEMDSILENATASDVGRFYMYVGETTDKYENGALYRVAKTDTISFTVSYLASVDGTGTAYNSQTYTADKNISWGAFADIHEDFTRESGDTILWRNGEAIKLVGEEVKQGDTIGSNTYTAY